MKKQTFRIATFQGPEEVEGYPVTLEGFEDMQFFAHRSGNGWNISEVKTGRLVPDVWYQTRKGAAEVAAATLRTIGRERVEATIAKHALKGGDNETHDNYQSHSRR